MARVPPSLMFQFSGLIMFAFVLAFPVSGREGLRRFTFPKFMYVSQIKRVLLRPRVAVCVFLILRCVL